MDQVKIGKFIAVCRKEINMTQKEFAERLGVTDKTVSRWENGHYLPDLSLFKELCSILQIEVNELLNGERNGIHTTTIEHTVDHLIEISNVEMKTKSKKIKFVSTILVLFITVLYSTAFIVSLNKQMFRQTPKGYSQSYSLFNVTVVKKELRLEDETNKASGRYYITLQLNEEDQKTYGKKYLEFPLVEQHANEIYATIIVGKEYDVVQLVGIVDQPFNTIQNLVGNQSKLQIDLLSSTNLTVNSIPIDPMDESVLPPSYVSSQWINNYTFDYSAYKEYTYQDPVAGSFTFKYPATSSIIPSYCNLNTETLGYDDCGVKIKLNDTQSINIMFVNDYKINAIGTIETPYTDFYVANELKGYLRFNRSSNYIDTELIYKVDQEKEYFLKAYISMDKEIYTTNQETIFAILSSVNK